MRLSPYRLGKPLLVAATLLAVPLFGACNDHDDHESHGGISGSKVQFDMKNGTLTLRKHIVIISVSGHQPAFVTTHGHLVIGRSNDDEVPTNDEQRAALVAYNAAANTVIDKGIEVGVEGAHFAADALGIVIKDAVNGNSENIGKDVKKGSEPLKDKARALCGNIDDWRKAQDQVARSIPAFEPYAVITDADIKDCWDKGIKDTDDEDSPDDSDDSDDSDASDNSPAKAEIKESISKSMNTPRHDKQLSAPSAAASAPAAPVAASHAPAVPPAPAKGADGGSTLKGTMI